MKIQQKDGEGTKMEEETKINRLTFFVSVYSVITSEMQSLSRKWMKTVI